MARKIITGIQLGLVEDKVGWVFQYENAPQESFSLHIGVARQFMQGLQELILLLEQQAALPPSGSKSGVGMADSVSVRLV